MKIKEVLNGFASAKVLIIGDLMLDRYIEGDVKRISPEAPVPVVEVREDRYVLGGSLNVAHNVKNLGAQTYVTGIIGADKTGDKLTSIVKRIEIDPAGLYHNGKRRPTTLKTRVMSGTHQIVRIDRESTAPLDIHERIKIVAYMRKLAELKKINYVIIEDYGKGVVTPELIEKLLQVAKEYNIKVVVDPKKTTFKLYKNVMCITPNRKEILDYTGESDYKKAAEILFKETQAENVLVTLGADGMYLLSKQYGEHHFESKAQKVFDVSGAGDTVIATLAVALSSGLPLFDALKVSKYAAEVVVGKVGTSPITLDELEQALNVT